MSKWRKGPYTPSNPAKYMGNANDIILRSQWEFTFADFCDSHSSILQWSSEPIKIPYFNPVKQKQSLYVPDFLIVYVDKFNKKHVELIEIKPYTQSMMEHAKTQAQRMVVAINHEKWKAAVRYCKHRAINFRLLTENEIYKNYTYKKKK